MASSASGGRSFTGVFSLNLYRLARASKYIREMPSDLMLLQPEAVMAPSMMDRFLLGMMRSGSTRFCIPRPVHTGHAPYGLLNENMRGVSSSIEMPQSSHA